MKKASIVLPTTHRILLLAGGGGAGGGAVIVFSCSCVLAFLMTFLNSFVHVIFLLYFFFFISLSRCSPLLFCLSLCVYFGFFVSFVLLMFVSFFFKFLVGYYILLCC